MKEQDTITWKTIQELKFTESDDAIGSDWLHPETLYETTYFVKAVTAQAVVESFAQACQKGQTVQLEFYDSHGLVKTVPIVKVEYLPKESAMQTMLGEFSADVIKVTVKLSQGQLWATTPLSELDPTPLEY